MYFENTTVNAQTLEENNKKMNRFQITKVTTHTAIPSVECFEEYWHM